MSQGGPLGGVRPNWTAILETYGTREDGLLEIYRGMYHGPIYEAGRPRRVGL